MLVEQQLVKFMRAKRLQPPLLLAIPVASLTLQVMQRRIQTPRGIAPRILVAAHLGRALCGFVGATMHLISGPIRTGSGLAWASLSPALAVDTQLGCAFLRVPYGQQQAVGTLGRRRPSAKHLLLLSLSISRHRSPPCTSSGAPISTP